MDSRDGRVRTGEYDHRRIERDAAHWLARRSDRGRPWTDADQAALDAWLAESAAHQVAWLRLEMVWQRGDRLQALAAGMPRGQVPPKGAWRRLPFFGRHDASVALRPGVATGGSSGEPVPAGNHGRARADFSGLRFRRRPSERRRSFAARMLGVAACMALVAATGAAWYGYQEAGEPLQWASSLGKTREVPLEDGSRATLSSDTRMEVVFSRRSRDTRLQQGEAYFDVAKDGRRPFVVHVGDAQVTAVGTRFAVREHAGAVRVVVTEGTVRLDAGTTAPGVPSALLEAGAVATVAHGTVRVESRSVEQAEELLGWRNGELVFRATPLAEAVVEFNRFSNRPLQIEDAELAGLKVDGGFRADNAEGFVRLLEQVFPVRAVRHADRIELQRQ